MNKVIYILIGIIVIASMWKVFTKANKPGWAFIVPIYGFVVWLEIIGKPIWWILLLLIPLVNIIIFIRILNLTSLSFGKGVGFTIGLIFLPFIFCPILGFGNDTYSGPAGK